MQVLKPEIREKILAAAEELFYETDYAGTSMRKIAENVGISFSNLYKYFDDKQALFAAIIDPFYHRIQTDLTSLFNEEHPPMELGIIERVTQQIIHLVQTDRRKFVILMGRSTETPYANFRDEVVGMLAKHMSKSVNPNLLRNDFILPVLASNFFEGILKIAESSNNEPSFITDNVHTLVRYHMAGIAQFC